MGLMVRISNFQQKKKTQMRERRYDEALIELALEVVLDIGARSHVGRNEDVGPVICPSWVFVVFVGSRRYSLQFLRIFLLFSHFLFFLILSLSINYQLVIVEKTRNIRNYYYFRCQ